MLGIRKRVRSPRMLTLADTTKESVTPRDALVVRRIYNQFRDLR